ncbi:DUF429 domain-containing protein [Halosolutus halophilus]|uniref:DUF429 domain-containing protein n=1 Tax=Halosolutus halophilus TaxID=1552990 RepID=UPI00223519B3|nr:DUF429 domain-containing protein [Halosolutus halophilus]
MSDTVGLDWGGNGWIAVIATGERDPTIDVAFYPSMLNAWRDNRDAERMLVDIPIGLADDERRECDAIARSILGADRSRVFFTPVRDAVYEDEYEAAGDANEAATGTRISTQAYHICPAIREVDGVLREIDAARELLRESHPEVCYAVLAGGSGVGPKSSDDGLERRRELLATELGWPVSDVESIESRHIDEQPTHARRLRAGNRDDLLDAFVLALTARGETASLPGDPPTDRHGLPMEIVAPATVSDLR